MVNFWDGEPSFYNQSTYHGAKKILAVGGAVQHQGQGAASAATATAPAVADDFTAWNVDFLLERDIGGVITLEGGYYRYDTGDVVDVVLPNDEGWFVLGGCLIRHPVAGARLQPHVRYQHLGPRRAVDVA
jgi:hypothetical protein